MDASSAPYTAGFPILIRVMTRLANVEPNFEGNPISTSQVDQFP